MNTPRVTRNGEPVKRSYRSAVRDAQARDTRRRIVDAASRLFIEEGYGQTTIDTVAAAAGVSRKTVFAAVGGKVELLKLAIDWAVAGDDEPIAVVARPQVRRLLAATDPGRLLRAWARVLVDIDVRVATLARALDTAADSDQPARTLRDRLHRQRLDGAAMIVDRLAELGVLRDGLRRQEAVDLAWLASDPALYEGLVRHRGWRAKRFEQWLADSLIAQLVG